MEKSGERKSDERDEKREKEGPGNKNRGPSSQLSWPGVEVTKPVSFAVRGLRQVLKTKALTECRQDPTAGRYGPCTFHVKHSCYW